MTGNNENRGRLNWKQACEILGCGKSSLYRLVSGGKLQSYGAGTRCRWYDREECENLAKKGGFAGEKAKI